MIPGLIAAATGLVEETPFLRETTTIGQYLDPRQQSGAVDRKLTSIAVPGLVQWLAQQTDKEHPFNPFESAVKRAPVGLGQTLETAIPGIRETVPAKKKR